MFGAMPGFRSRLWAVNPATRDYAGRYEWHDDDRALDYATGLLGGLGLISRAGSVTCELVSGFTVEESPTRQALVHGDAG